MPHEETRAETLAYRWSFLAVYAGAAFGLIWLGSTAGGGALAELGTLAATSLLLFGKFIIFAPDRLIGPWGLALMVWLIDLMVAFALSSGLGAFERMPLVGSWLGRARTRAVQVLAEFPRLERMAFLGVVVFVLLPLASTGAVTGSFAARLTGLSRLAGVLAIALGSAGTAACFAFAAVFLGERAEEVLRSPVLAGTMALVLVAFGWFAYSKAKELLRR
ncbi:MAG: small multi-drug export protein [Planctomycetota bacterium]